MKVPVSYQEIAHCLDKSISKIEAAVLSALEQTPPELYADIVKNGIYLPVAALCCVVSTNVCATRWGSNFTWQTILCMQ